MIKLSIMPYCHDCPMFKVKQDTNALTAVGEIEPAEVNTILTCENAARCTRIEKYIRTIGEKDERTNLV